MAMEFYAKVHVQAALARFGNVEAVALPAKSIIEVLSSHSKTL